MSEARLSQIACLAADFDRYCELYPDGSRRSWLFRLRVSVGEEAFWVIFWYRIARWTLLDFRVPVVSLLLRLAAKLALRLLRLTHGIAISPACEAGPGLYFGHFGGVWINPRVRMGKQVTILNGVTIGEGGQGTTAGVPTIGDFVYVGPHAVVVSKVSVGNGCVIAANSLVVTDVPDGATAIGVPARVMVRSGNPLAARAAEEREAGRTAPPA